MQAIDALAERAGGNAQLTVPYRRIEHGLLMTVVG